jgi:hypothetical protein
VLEIQAQCDERLRAAEARAASADRQLKSEKFRAIRAERDVKNATERVAMLEEALKKAEERALRAEGALAATPPLPKSRKAAATPSSSNGSGRPLATLRRPCSWPGHGPGPPSLRRIDEEEDAAAAANRAAGAAGGTETSARGNKREEATQMLESLMTMLQNEGQHESNRKRCVNGEPGTKPSPGAVTLPPAKAGASAASGAVVNDKTHPPSEAGDSTQVRSAATADCLVRTLSRAAEIQQECLADDIALDERMCAWSEQQLRKYFDSGGEPA